MRTTRALLSVAALGVLAMPAHAQWDAESPITSTGGDVWGEGIATSGSYVYLVYGTGEVRFRSSSDQGATWSSEVPLDSGTLHLTDPMVADGQDIWILEMKNLSTEMDWCCPRDVGDLYLLHSGDRGASWDPPERLTTGAQAFRYSIAYAADRLHVVWMDFRSNAWDTYYLRSEDRGASWDAERVIAASAGTFGAERPQVAARGDGVHVTIWDDRGTNPPCMAGTFSFDPCADTFYLGSRDGGDTWGAEVPVSYSGAAFAGRNDIAVAGASGVVVNFNRAAEGTADANPFMFVVRSADNGATWEPALQLTDQIGSADHGAMIGRGADVHLAWHDSRSGSLAIYYQLSRDEGETWLDDEELVSTATGTDSSTPLIDVTSGYVHVIWLDRRSGSYQIYYRRRAIEPAPGTPDAGVPGPDASDSGGDDDGTSGAGCCRTSEGPSGAIPVALLTLAVVLRRRWSGRSRRSSRAHRDASVARTSSSCANVSSIAS